MLPLLRDAEVIIEKYKPLDGNEVGIKGKLFEPDEVDRAEAIVNSLKGMSIASAQQLLEKINKYLLMDEIK